jgi:hypothetical protein
MKFKRIILILTVILLAGGCAAGNQRVVTMETTGYCGCGKCCNWEHSGFLFLQKSIRSGPSAGRPYTGKTASGTTPHISHPGLFSIDSLIHPWMIPIRIVFFPWLFLPSDGTLAADTRYRPFGTRIFIPDYGWGVVEDRGSAIKGPDRLDLYFSSHDDALKWGRRRVEVIIEDNR